MRHGTNYGYSVCKDGNPELRGRSRACGLCRDAHAAHNLALIRQRAKLLTADPALAPHGKASTYRNWACRCELCTKAVLAAERKRRGRGRATPLRSDPIGREWTPIQEPDFLAYVRTA